MALQEIFKKIQTKNCIIEVYGLGYIGLPSAVRLAMAGFQIVGIDKDLAKIKRLENKNLSESELFLKNEFVEAQNSGLLTIS